MTSAEADLPAEQTKPGRRIRGLSADQRREQRRTDLLAAALELFAAQGYANTSIEQLCQVSYVSTRSFYEIFSGREDCYKVLFGDVTEQLQNEMLERLADLPEDEEAATELLVRSFVDTLLSDPRRSQVLLGPSRAITPDVELMRRVNRQWAAAFVEDFWRRFGIVGDNHAIAVALIGGMYDVVSLWLIDGDADDEASVAALSAPLDRFYRAVRRGLEQDRLE